MYFSAVPTLFLTSPPPTESRTIISRRQKCIDDENQSFEVKEEQDFFDDYNNISLTSNDYETLEETTEELIAHDSCSSEHDFHLKSGNNSDYFQSYDECTENEELTESENTQTYKKQVSFETDFNVTSDSSAQTDSDNLLQNYNQLLNRNENLETEVINWRNKCKN